MVTRELGDRIRSRRRALDLTQDDVALSIGVNRRVVGEIERGKPTVQLGIVLRLLEALGLELTVTERA